VYGVAVAVAELVGLRVGDALDSEGDERVDVRDDVDEVVRNSVDDVD
jgi:hypothetical protein